MILTPDNIQTVKIGSETLTIKVKIIPDSARATKDICSYIKQGDRVKPCQRLNNGTGKPKGITLHNTGDIKAAAGTDPAEQYARSTYPNGNMKGVVVHYYVWHNVIWQQLADNERGWHAADGSSRRKDHRGGQTGGNLDTIAIECIGADAESEATTAKLAAYLCEQYGLDPALDVYTHNYWMHGKDSIVSGARKNCPIYILPHWDSFLAEVKRYYGGTVAKTSTYSGTLPTLPAKGYLGKGDTGTQVKRLQQFLNWYGGYGLAVDGSYGPATVAAVKRYQQAEGLAADGKFGPASQARAAEVRK